jgi:hypothetical protein
MNMMLVNATSATAIFRIAMEFLVATITPSGFKLKGFMDGLVLHEIMANDSAIRIFAGRNSRGWFVHILIID